MIGLVKMLNASPVSTLSGGIFETIHCYSFLTREEKNLASEIDKFSFGFEKCFVIWSLIFLFCLIQNSDLVTIEEQVLKLISVTLPRSSAKNTD